jgi:FMN phosphatase YigB (HAD superfamily)
MNLWIFDNDGMLYDDAGIKVNFPKTFLEYFVKVSGIKTEDAFQSIIDLKKKWRTDISVIALVKEYGVDFIDAVNNTYLKIDLDRCGIPTSDDLRSIALSSIKDKKIVFTNSPSIFARRILTHNKLIRHFSDFIGIQETQFIEKPNLSAFMAIQNIFKDYGKIIFCDNSLENLEVAYGLGWFTIWYNPKMEGVDQSIECKHIIISSFKQLENIITKKIINNTNLTGK